MRTVNSALLLSSTLKTAIHPDYIYIPPTSNGMQFAGAFDNAGFELIAARLIRRSKQAHRWVGLFKDDLADINTIEKMYRIGLLSKNRIYGRWEYALTPLAIEKIYKARTESLVSCT